MKQIDRTEVGNSSQVSGFTLIELIIALGVFTTGIVAAFTLAISNLNLAKQNFHRTAGANLAREGVELVRNIRDSNWLAIDANADVDGNAGNGIQLYEWDTGLKEPSFTFFKVSVATDIFALGYGTFPLTTCSGDTEMDACMANCGNECQLKKDSNGFYTAHGSLGGARTPFYRAIELESICLIGLVEHTEDRDECNAGEKIGIKVTSRVAWQGKGGLEHIDVVENLYNWRR